MLEILYIYITVFTAYFICLTMASMQAKRKYRDKYTPKDSNLCIVVYATGITNTLENLLKQLKSQNYPSQNYTIYTILDKCENVSEVTLQSDLNVNVININNIEPIGKSQAYSIIAEKLHDVNDLDAYVFLDSKNYVDSDFLKNVNFYLTKNDVFNPTLVYLPQNESMSFKQKIESAYWRYISKFLFTSRTVLGLTNIIDTDSFIIKKDLLNKISNFDFKDLISEVNYTYSLAKEGIKVFSVDDLRVYTSIESFNFRIPSLSKRLGFLWENILKPQNYIAREFLLSLSYPNWLLIFLSYFFLLKHSYIFPFMTDYSTILISSIVLLIAFCISLVNSKLESKECLYFLIYPFYSVFRIFYNLPIVRCIRNIIKNTTRKHIIEKMTVQVIVSDGIKDYPCQLELISDDGLAKVTFINRGKKYTTKNNHLRMIDAVRELTTKLSDYGMTLKVCQCCKYFHPLVDGSTNMVKGCCNCQFQGRTPGDIIPTLIWNTCPKFEEHNVINLF